MYQYDYKSSLSKQQLTNKLQTKSFNQIKQIHNHHVGFNHKRRPINTFKLLPTNYNIQTINKKQQTLIRQIRDIDNILQKQHNHLQYRNGYLFGQNLGCSLVTNLMEMLRMRSDAIQYGFNIWKVQESQEGFNLVSSRIGYSPKKFGLKLIQASIASIQKYDRQKYEQSVKNARKQWEPFSKGEQKDLGGRHIRFKTESSHVGNRQLSEEQHNKLQKINKIESKLRRHSGSVFENQQPSQINIKNEHKLPFLAIPKSYLKHKGSDISISNKQPNRQLNIYKTNNRTNLGKIIHPQPPNPPQIPTLQQLQKMLKKQNRIVSIWSPPSNYPQLLGIISIQFINKQERDKSSSYSIGVIKKYYWNRYGVSRKLFDSILEWTSSEYVILDRLELTVNRQLFGDVFQNIGWKVKSWINANQLRIIYKPS